MKTVKCSGENPVILLGYLSECAVKAIIDGGALAKGFVEGGGHAILALLKAFFLLRLTFLIVQALFA
jgi:hypothetical protein